MLIQKLPQRKYTYRIHANWLKIMYVSISQIDSIHVAFFVFAKVGKGQLLSKDERFWNKKAVMVCLNRFHVAVRLCGNRSQTNVVRTSVTHSAIASCGTFLFLPHFEVMCDLLPNRGTATWNLFVNSYKSTSVLSRMPFSDWRRFSLFILF